MKNKIKIAFIGCGNMARAIISSMTNISVVHALKANGDEFKLTACDRNENKLLMVRDVCDVTLDRFKAVAAADYVFLAIKPQSAEEAVAGLELKNKTIISIMAGISIEKLKAMTGSSKIVRVMPNLCAGVGESFNAFTADGISDDLKPTILEILGSFGLCREVKESDMDSVTGITGSGPAFVFMAIKAFYDEALAQGYDADTAKEMAIQTVVGSALTAERSPLDFDTLIASVCSKGGTTIEGVDHLKACDFENILRGAIQRSIARSKEMSK